MAHPSSRTWPWAIAVAVLAIALAAPAITSGTFVNGDGSVLRLPLVATWRNLPTIFSRDFMIHTEGQYRPLSAAVLAVVHTFVPADRTVFWHAWLAGFHGLNAVLVFLLASQFTRRRLAAAAAGALFAAHPMSALFVNHMNAFHHVLGGTFALGTVLAYVRFVKSGRKRTYVWVPVLLVAGLFTSRLVLAAPVLLVLYELLWVRGGLRRPAARLLPVALCCLAVAPCWLWLEPNPMHYEYPVFPEGSGVYSLYTFLGRTGSHVRGVLGGYGFEGPLGETTERITGIAHPAFARVLLWGGVLAVVLAAALLLMWRRRAVGFGVLLAVLSVAPFASVAFYHVRDYISWYQLYLVVAGSALVAGTLVDAGMGLGRHARRAVVLCAVLLVGVYAVMCVRANLRTRSAETYWHYVLTLNPDSSAASVGIGEALLARGDVDNALDYLFCPAVKNTLESGFAMVLHYIDDNQPLAAAVHFNAAVAWQPREFHARNRVQMVGARLVATAHVLDYAEQAMAELLMTDAYDTSGLRLMAEVLAEKGRVRAACMVLEEAARIDPGDARTTRLLDRIAQRLYHAPTQPPPAIAAADYDWLVYVMKGTMTQPLREQTIGLSERFPSDPVLAFKAGECLLELGQPGLARPKLLAATARMPTHPQVRDVVGRIPPDPDDLVPDRGAHPTFLNDRGYALFEENKLVEAEAYFRAAVKGDPKFAVALNNLAQVLRLQGKADLAIATFRKVVALIPDDPDAWVDLAAACAENGDFTGAVAAARRAAAIARRHGDAALLKTIEERLERYERKLPAGPGASDARP